MAKWLKKLLTPRAAPSHSAATAPTSEDERRKGNAHMGRGELPAAVAAYRRAVALAPDSVDARIGLGYALRESGQLPAAQEALRAAAHLQPDHFDATYLLGQVCTDLQRHAEAARHFEHALALRPDFEPLYGDLCRALFENGDMEGAQRTIGIGIQRFPENASFRLFLGNLLFHRGENTAASDSYKEALRLDESLPGAYGNLGTILKAQGAWQAALLNFDRAAKLNESEPEFQLGKYECLLQLGRRDDALKAILCALALAPSAAKVHQNLGYFYLQAGRYAEAEAHSRKALAIDALNAEAHNNLSALLIAQGRFIDAEESARKACELAPDSGIFQSNLGVCLLRQGKLAQATACFRSAMTLDPRHIESGSNLLFALSADPQSSLAAYFTEAQRVGERLAAIAGAPFTEWPAAQRAGTNSPLRVAVVSGQLCNGSVGSFLEGLVAHVNPSSVQLVAYDTGNRQDTLTDRIRPNFAEWHAVANLPAVDLARKICGDGIQILIDLHGHTEGNSLAAFALKPAPLQISWLGYWASTGLRTIDHVLADPVCVPEADRRYFTEQVVDMPHTRLCFTPPAIAVQVSPPPAIRNGFVTFGSYQALTKIHDGVLSAWGEVLRAVPNARLKLTSHQLVSDERFRRDFNRRLHAANIDTERVTLAGPLAREAYLASYAQIDIVLDTFPYTGGTTTCEALWMGVPTLTIRGDSMIARQGAGMLECVGLTDWIAEDQDDYVAKAAVHASDLQRLLSLRQSLRDQAMGSPLFDARRFAAHWESALQFMWNECAMRRA